MKSILCYGDSNTWGAATVHRPDGRYPTYERWPGVLRNTLGPHWLVIEEGLGGRTTVRDDPVEGADKNGLTYLMPCLRSHRPLDVVAIMLGTNDLKARFNLSAWDVAEAAGLLVTTALKAECGRNNGAPEVLLIAPPPFRPELPNHADMFAGAYEKSREFAKRYKAVAERLKVRFFDAGSVITSSKVDGFHLDPEAHDVLGRALAAEVNKIPIKGS